MGDRRVAMVTGASSGIGRAVAPALGGLGWAVAIGARRVDRLEATAEEIGNAGGKPFAHALDVADPKSVDAFFATAQDALGPIDVVVNNAGMSVPGALHKVSDADLEREVATNLLGPMYVSRRAIASMLERGAGGDLVFISSDATRNARPRMAAYSATKAGVELLARSLSMELEGTGIRSTTVRIGPTLTEFGFEWDMDEVQELMEFWPKFGLQRHAGLLDPSAIVRAVVFVVTAPEGVHIDTIEVQPAAPTDGGPAQIIDRPS